MVGGVVVDWLEREWLRGTRGYERFSITLPSSLTAILDMFTTDIVRTDLANRPTELMLVSSDTQYTKL